MVKEIRPPHRKVMVAWTALENLAWNRVGMKIEEVLNILDILPCTESAHLAACNCKKEKKIPKAGTGIHEWELAGLAGLGAIFQPF